MGKIIDLTGQKFGRLIVLERASDTLSKEKEKKQHTTFWNCKCECGNTTIASKIHLEDGHIRSCGCLHDESSKVSNKKHGLYNTRLHNIWTSMIQRCTNPKNHKYKRYGARGKKVFDNWGEFINFYNWAIENGYDDTLSIDRINNNGNYEPQNCRWVDNVTQIIICLIIILFHIKVKNILLHNYQEN